MEINRSYVFEFNGKPANVDDIIQFILNEKVEYVFLDFGGTVVDLSNETKEKMVRYINGKGKHNINQDILELALAKEWEFRRKDPIDQKAVKSVKDKKEEEKYWLSFYSSMLRRQLKFEDVDNQMLRQLAELQADPASFEVFPFFEDLLSELDKMRIKIGIISNGFDSAWKILKHAGLINKFDTIILSCDHNSIKPEPEIYQKAVDQAALEPSKILFIDDHKPFVDAAVEFGMLGAQITHKIISVDDNVQKIGKEKTIGNMVLAN